MKMTTLDESQYSIRLNRDGVVIRAIKPPIHIHQLFSWLPAGDNCHIDFFVYASSEIDAIAKAQSHSEKLLKDGRWVPTYYGWGNVINRMKFPDSGIFFHLKRYLHHRKARALIASGRQAEAMGVLYNLHGQDGYNIYQSMT